MYTKKHIEKADFEMTVWRHFPVVDRSVRLSLFYNDQFSIRWVPLADKLLNSQQNKNKNL